MYKRSPTLDFRKVVTLTVLFLFKQIEQLKQKADKRVRSVSTCQILVVTSMWC